MKGQSIAVVDGGSFVLPYVHSFVKALQASGHEVLVLHVLDPAERDFPDSAEALYRDPESLAEMAATPSDVRVSYQATVQEALAEWRAAIGRSGARYALATTDEPFGRPLRQLRRLRSERSDRGALRPPGGACRATRSTRLGHPGHR